MKTLEQIASELVGYDPQALSADLVGSFLDQLIEPLTEAEDIDIFAALGRVLAADIISPVSVPPHD
ncbi:MAG: molybdopterin molybdenumtransferase MoeA, partial [Comamonadaceae bacterium CG17_big_fil_post_rev_8_21_14_2_50_60_13]